MGAILHNHHSQAPATALPSPFYDQQFNASVVLVPPSVTICNVLLMTTNPPPYVAMEIFMDISLCCSLFIHLHKINGISLRNVPITRYLHSSTTTHKLVVYSTASTVTDFRYYSYRSSKGLNVS